MRVCACVDQEVSGLPSFHEKTLEHEHVQLTTDIQTRRHTNTDMNRLVDICIYICTPTNTFAYNEEF